MKSLINFRSLIYWAQDRAMGRGVAHELRDIEECFASPAICLRRVDDRLNSLLKHANCTTDYYRPWRGARSLRDFPVLRKATLKERQDSFISTSYEPSRLAVKSTSGSYGIPLRAYMTPQKRARQWAEIIYFSRWAGYKVGEPYVDVTNYAGRSRWNHFMRNRVPCNPGHLPKTWAREQRAKLLRSNARVMIGYPSAVRLIADECLRRGDDPQEIGITSVITTAEPLFEDTRFILHRAFGCPVMSRYSAHETGVVAHERHTPGQHVVNQASYVVEILKADRDEPAEPDETGRVIVTDLFSHAMPLIRYEIGDSSRFLVPPGEEDWPTLASISGRAVEQVFDTEEVPIVPERIAFEMRIFDRVRQFQFAQTDEGEYVIRLVIAEGFAEEEVVRWTLRKLVGDRGYVRVEYCDAIAALPSGKRPCIVNETPTGGRQMPKQHPEPVLSA